MDHIEKVLPEVLRGPMQKPRQANAPTPTRSKGISTVSEPQPDVVMRKLWLRMAQLLGHRWTSSFGADAGADVGKTWARELADLSFDQLAAGLSAVAVAPADWWPTLPAFREMCFCVPAFALVRAELAAKDSSRSPFTLLAWHFLDRARYRLADADKADRLLREAYDIAREHVMRGGALPEPVPEIDAPEKPKRVRASDDFVRSACAEIETILGKTEPPEAP
jgi:hypothetical protein